MKMCDFKLLETDGYHARRGRLITAHGIIETPTFMPVATYGSIRMLDFEDIKKIGAKIILGNTLRLESTVTAARIKEFGGLARFTGWNGPTLTDSGGYQVSYMWKSGTHSADGGATLSVFADKKVGRREFVYCGLCCYFTDVFSGRLRSGNLLLQGNILVFGDLLFTDSKYGLFAEWQIG